MLKFLDGYTIRARLFPAIIAGAPALAAVALLISWNKIALSNVVATIGLLVLVFALADLARRQGKRLEAGIYDQMGGKPSVTMLRYSDTSLDASVKERYREFLGGKIKSSVPTEAAEKTSPAVADTFYEKCGNWLRENTRDIKTFSILFNENVTYGFRRNLLGLKWPALIVNVLVVCICGGILWRSWPINMDDSLTTRVIVVLIVAAIHALYIGLVVTRAGVMEAARTYARQLILSCETFLATEKPPTKPKVPKKGPKTS
jgi:hypothetical protein